MMDCFMSMRKPGDAIAVYTFLCAKTWAEDEQFCSKAFVSSARKIGRMLGISRKRVVDVIEELAQRDLIAVSPNGYGNEMKFYF